MADRINVVYGSINPFSSEHGRAMQIYPRVARKSNINILWVDPPIFSKNLFKSLKLFTQIIANKKIIIYDNIRAISPIGFPYYLSNKYSWLITTFISFKVINTKCNIFINTKCDIFIISSPIFVKRAKLLQSRGIPIIYDCRDVFSKWKHVGKCAIDAEKELISIANVVITSSESIKNEVLNININANVIAISNGVPLSMIKKCPEKTIHSKPRIGFVGHMGYYVDIDLIIEIAKDRPNMEFIFVGDCTPIAGVVKNAPKNCEFMGEVPFEDLDKLYCTFDVGLIPFKINDLTNPIIPIKLIEYFAKGLPVVCSQLKEVKRLDEDNLIHYAIGKNEWFHKIDMALKDTRHDEFIEFAKKYTWEDATEKYYNVIENVLCCNQK